MSNTTTSLALPRREHYSRTNVATWAGFGVIAAFVLALTLWSTLAPVSGAAIARGSLHVEGQRQAVQHPYGGIVKQLLVKQGQRVTKGQVLLTLFDSEPRARLDVLQADRDAQKAQESRLTAERDGAAEPQFSDDLLKRATEPGVAQAIANERAVMAARKRQYDSEIQVLGQKTAQLHEQVKGIRAQIAGYDRQHALLEEEAKGARELLTSGYTPKNRVLALERDLARLQAEAGERRADVARADEAIAANEFEIAKAERVRLTEITDSLKATQSRLAESGPKIDAARDVLERTSIVAPATGSVVGLTAFTEGGVIQQGARILDIVPTGIPLMVEARLPLADVSEIKPGSHADVRLTSINRNERPTIGGSVVTVSADRLTDERSGEAYFAVQVQLDPEDVKKSNVDLQPGMAAEVVVTTRPRTLIEYLIGPLTDEINGAFREK